MFVTLIYRQVSELSGKPTSTKSPKEPVHYYVTELKKMADVHLTDKEPNRPMRLMYHPFLGSASDGNSEDSDQETFSYGDWTARGSAVNVRLAVNQALLRAVQVANAMVDKDEEKLECNKGL